MKLFKMLNITITTIVPDIKMSHPEYGKAESFPAWTDPEPGILEPLRLPESKETTPIFEDQVLLL